MSDEAKVPRLAISAQGHVKQLGLRMDTLVYRVPEEGEYFITYSAYGTSREIHCIGGDPLGIVASNYSPSSGKDGGKRWVFSVGPSPAAEGGPVANSVGTYRT